MENKSSQHSQEVWEKFWVEKEEIEQVYSNSDRIVNQILGATDLTDKLVMEVGAGSGRDGFKLVDAGATVILLDYAESSLRVIKSLSCQLSKKVLLVRGDAFHLPIKSNALDLVFHQGLLEHFTNPADILAENFRVLKVGGLALADVPQRYHAYTVIKHLLIWMNKWFAGWETEFSRRQLVGFFRHVGFEIHIIYGDWMRPSFAYRIVREVAKKLGIKLPLYPAGLGPISHLRAKVRSLFRRTDFSLNTVMDIGVIGIK